MKAELLSTNLNKSAEIDLSSSHTQGATITKTCAQVAQPIQKILLKPEDSKQENSRTKQDLLPVINPANEDIPI